MFHWLLELLSLFGKPPPSKEVKTPSEPKAPQTARERDLSIRGIDDTSETLAVSPPPQILEPPPVKKEVSLFKFSRRSLGILDGKHPKHGRMSRVYPPLADVIRLSINYSVLDMTILNSTLRTREEQASFVESGTSRTMDSLHLPQESGFVHAVDVAAMERGSVSWRPEVYFDIADAVQKAARELDVDVVWGGCWSNLNTDMDVDDLHAKYINRKRLEQRRPFFDGPHFQLR